MIIWPFNELIPLKIGDLTFKISQLSVEQKMLLSQFLSQIDKDNAEIGGLRAGKRAVQLCLKEVSGLSNPDGSPYQLQKDPQGYLTDNCVEEILGLNVSGQLISICLGLFHGFTGECKDIQGNQIPGVSLIKSGEPKPGKKSKAKAHASNSQS
ncbi:MAG: hypothetical protein ACOH5I_21885 [Oligoflexus sp.]